jgi:two-component system cell cycle response regulator
MSSAHNTFPVLVVDDSPVSHKLVEQALPPERHAILPAKTAQEALELFAKHRPGLVITDWLIPDLSGIEFCQRLRTDFRECFAYIIMLTAVSEKSELVKGLQAGADEYLTKPFHAAELLARVEVGKRIVELHRTIEVKNRLLQQLALTDPLTSLPNRRAIEQWGKRQVSGAGRYDFTFSVVVVDIDNFKSVNDTYGHEAGDTVLKSLAATLEVNTREGDMCARIGGDEFLLAISHTDRVGVQAAVERIRQQVEDNTFNFGGHDVTVTASFGVADFRRRETLDFERLVTQADVALYSAKRLGRNRVGCVPADMH